MDALVERAAAGETLAADARMALAEWALGDAGQREVFGVTPLTVGVTVAERLALLPLALRAVNESRLISSQNGQIAACAQLNPERNFSTACSLSMLIAASVVIVLMGMFTMDIAESTVTAPDRLGRARFLQPRRDHVRVIIER